MNKKISSLCCSLALLTLGCQSGPDLSQMNAKGTDNPLISYFDKIPADDTLRFEVVDEALTASGRAIPPDLFFASLDSRLVAGIGFLDSQSSPMIIARYCMPLEGNVQACLVDVRQGWYQNQSFLLHDTLAGKITQQVTLASFYGGDGGQVLQGSWWFDYDGDGVKDIVRKEIEHWLLVAGETPRDSVAERANLLLWNGQGYAPGKAEPIALARQFPIKSHW